MIQDGPVDSFHKLNQPDFVDLRLFCFPHAGGGASMFNRWASYLPDTVELYALQLPGRESRLEDELITDINHAIISLSHEFPYESKIPFIFFGHSLGALLGFELSRQLRRVKGLQPASLIVSGATAPQYCQKKGRISKKSDNDFLERVKSYGGIEECILKEKELMSLLLPMIRADFSLLESYQYYEESPFSFDITTISGTEDDTCPSEDVYAWERHSEGVVEHNRLSGGHFFIKESSSKVLEIVNRVIMKELSNEKRKP